MGKYGSKAREIIHEEEYGGRSRVSWVIGERKNQSEVKNRVGKKWEEGEPGTWEEGWKRLFNMNRGREDILT